MKSAATFLNIVRVLATLRARQASRLHNQEIRDGAMGKPQSELMPFKDELATMLPPRRQWSRPGKGLRNRRGMTKEAVLRDSIIRTVQGIQSASRLPETSWGCNLIAFVERIAKRIEAADFAIKAPRLWVKKKDLSEGKIGYRIVASYEDLSDRVLLALASKSICNRVDRTFSKNSFAFRTSRPVSYNTAVRKLQDYRMTHPGDLFVTRCDIKEFFDSVEHAQILAVAGDFMRHGLIDQVHYRLIEAYLHSYDLEFARNQLQRQSPELSTGLPEGRIFPKGRCGLPQGGVLSSVLSNMVLDRLDKVLDGIVEAGGFYARYCDDMILVHSDTMVCKKYQEALLNATHEIGLELHAPIASDAVGSDFFQSKAVCLCQWSKSSHNWIPFLGYCVKADGSLRLRNESIVRQKKTLLREFTRFSARLKQENVKKNRLPKIVERFVINVKCKSIGRVDPCGRSRHAYSWIGAFPLLEHNPDVDRQLKNLDRYETSLLHQLFRMFRLSECETGARLHYMGAPYSYYGAITGMSGVLPHVHGNERRFCFRVCHSRKYRHHFSTRNLRFMRHVVLEETGLSWNDFRFQLRLYGMYRFGDAEIPKTKIRLNKTGIEENKYRTYIQNLITEMAEEELDSYDDLDPCDDGWPNEYGYSGAYS